MSGNVFVGIASLPEGVNEHHNIMWSYQQAGEWTCEAGEGSSVGTCAYGIQGSSHPIVSARSARMVSSTTTVASGMRSTIAWGRTNHRAPHAVQGHGPPAAARRWAR